METFIKQDIQSSNSRIFLIGRAQRLKNCSLILHFAFPSFFPQYNQYFLLRTLQTDYNFFMQSANDFSSQFIDYHRKVKTQFPETKSVFQSQGVQTNLCNSKLKFNKQHQIMTNKNCKYVITVIFILLFLPVVQSVCYTGRQTLYISEVSSCQVKYDECISQSLIRCWKIQCSQDGTQCITTMQTSYLNTCSQYCCSNYQNINNNDMNYSLNMCKQNVSSSTSLGVGSIILIIVFVGTFVVLFIIVCFCKKRRSQNNTNDSNIAAIPATTVNLKSYDLDTQGPYFVNSNDSCAICLDKQVNLRTHCNHFYHAKCLLSWLKKKINNPCPLCMGTNYNPIKVYCQQCHAGDKLVIINASTPEKLITQYDLHKCTNCNKFGNQTFTLSEQQNDDQLQKKLSALNKNIAAKLNQEHEEESLHGDQHKLTSYKQKKRNRKVQSLKKVKVNKTNNNEQENADQSQKKFHPNGNNSSLGP